MISIVYGLLLKHDLDLECLLEHDLDLECLLEHDPDLECLLEHDPDFMYILESHLYMHCIRSSLQVFQMPNNPISDKNILVHQN